MNASMYGCLQTRRMVGYSYFPTSYLLYTQLPSTWRGWVSSTVIRGRSASGSPEVAWWRRYPFLRCIKSAQACEFGTSRFVERRDGKSYRECYLPKTTDTSALRQSIVFWKSKSECKPNRRRSTQEWKDARLLSLSSLTTTLLRSIICSTYNLNRSVCIWTKILCKLHIISGNGFQGHSARIECESTSAPSFTRLRLFVSHGVNSKAAWLDTNN